MKIPMRPDSVSKLVPAVLAAVVWVVPTLACINGETLHPVAKGSLKPLGFPQKSAPMRSDDLAVLRTIAAPRPELPALPGLTTEAFMAPAPQPFAAFVAEFEATRRAPLNRTYARRIDYAVALIRLGRTRDAIAELRSLEKAFPGQYRTAANLGTAYELEGQLEDALAWIGRGIERNPESHAGTEWLHVAILKAKLALGADPAWLATHSVLETAGARERDEVVRAIEYQLNERLVFVRPEDPVVCDLFYQAAERLDLAQPGMRERREEYLRASLRFGGWRQAEVERALRG